MVGTAARMNHMLKQMDTRLRQEQAQRKLAQDAVQAFKSESSIIMSQLQDSLANVTQQYKQEGLAVTFLCPPLMLLLSEFPPPQTSSSQQGWDFFRFRLLFRGVSWLPSQQQCPT